MNNQSDIPQLQSIILGPFALRGDNNTIHSNSLIMKSIEI